MAKRFGEAEFERWGAHLDPELVQVALTHRSWAYEHDAPHNERLEFLGDSILGMVVAAFIYETWPDMNEGDMSKIKAAAVSERSLAKIARKLDLGSYIKLGKGELANGGAEKDSILSDTVEALIGLTYRQHGMDVARSVVLALLEPAVREARDMGPALDWRTALEERARELGLPTDLSYEITGTGPDHARVYTAKVFLGGVYRGTGTASSQKQAKLEACKDAYLALAA